MVFQGVSTANLKDTDISTAEGRRKLVEYLDVLNEQLKFLFTNIDQDNLSEELYKLFVNTSNMATAVTNLTKKVDELTALVNGMPNNFRLNATAAGGAGSIFIMYNGNAVGMGVPLEQIDVGIYGITI